MFTHAADVSPLQRCACPQHFKEALRSQLFVWCGRGCIVLITTHRTRIQPLNYIAFICFLRRQANAIMLSTCMCVSIHVSPSNFWASAWLWSLLAEGQRPWQHQAHESHQENEHLVWNKENILTVPKQQKPPSSPLDSKGSNMSCKTKRNKALPVLWFVEAPWHSSKRYHELWPPTRYPAPPEPLSRGLKQLLVKAVASLLLLFQRERETPHFPSISSLVTSTRQLNHWGLMPYNSHGPQGSPDLAGVNRGFSFRRKQLEEAYVSGREN